MSQSFTFTTEKKNCYVYSPVMNRFLLVHPVLKFLIELENQGKNPQEWLNGLRGYSRVIEGYGRVSKKKIRFYFKKYLLLQKNGYFKKPDIKQKISGRLTVGDVEPRLANLDHVVFETTDACNLKCEYCGYGKFYANYDKRKNKNLDIATAKNLLEYLKKLWDSPLNQSFDRTINIGFYGGEPLLNLEFIKKIAAYVKNMLPPPHRFNFSMTTNGLL
ncbi:radical SAM protein, partial [Acidobacteriota bacterium]